MCHTLCAIILLLFFKTHLVFVFSRIISHIQISRNRNQQFTQILFVKFETQKTLCLSVRETKKKKRFSFVLCLRSRKEQPVLNLISIE